MRRFFTFLGYLILITACGQNTQQLSEANIITEIEEKVTTSNHYTCFYTNKSPLIDGHIKESVWQKAAWTNAFLPTKEKVNTSSSYATQAKMLWDEQYFYFAAQLKDEHIWATLQQRDTVLYLNDVFELFIDPDGDRLNYYEIEINPLGTIWDLKLDKTYNEGGQANSNWNISAIKKAIAIKGTLNKNDDKDEAWRVELAIPWQAFEEGKAQNGDTWRVNMTRGDWDEKNSKGVYIKSEQLKNMWTWSPLGKPSHFHQPEKWGYVTFVKKEKE